MKKLSDTIIINGEHFNARTGHPVASQVGTTKVVKNVDGILPKHVVATVLTKPAQYSQPMSTVVNKPVMDFSRQPVNPSAKHQPQRGQTLMRRALNKPEPTLKRRARITSAHAASGSVAVPTVLPKITVSKIDESKLRRATATAKSKQVKKFSAGAMTKLKAARLSSPAMEAVVEHEVVAHNLALQPSMDIFEKALQRATGHQQVTPDHVKKSLKKAQKTKRLVQLAAVGFAAFVVTAFVIYQNIPTIKFQYASQQAGFHAALPSNRPAGFALGKLSYQAGSISVSFHSNSDDRTFAISQKPSAWDSQTLRDKFLATTGQQYHVAEVSGRTVYIYGNNNATWVSDGVWYQVQANGNLNEQQVLDLAGSI